MKTPKAVRTRARKGVMEALRYMNGKASRTRSAPALMWLKAPRSRHPGNNQAVIRDERTKRPKRPYSTEQLVSWLNRSSATVPTTEVPNRSSSGDHTAIAALPGTMATMPPPTPLLAGRPTR